jgi:hypothetical protein
MVTASTPSLTGDQATLVTTPLLPFVEENEDEDEEEIEDAAARL